MSNFSELERRRKFFYAEADVDSYDISGDLHTPYYTQMHQVLMDLLCLHAKGCNQKDKYGILDIGSGTGIETISSLDLIPQSVVVAIDICLPMLERHYEKMDKRYGIGHWQKRCTLVEGDILGSPGRPKSLLKSLHQISPDSKFSAVISSLTLHHLKLNEKRFLYKRIYELLEPGGVFINADLFSFHDQSLAKAATSFLTDWIKRQFNNPEKRFQSSVRKLGSKAAELSRKWVLHVLQDNLPLPIEGKSLGDSKDTSGKMPRALSESELLLNVGFKNIIVPFRYWEVGVLWSKKPELINRKRTE